MNLFTATSATTATKEKGLGLKLKSSLGFSVVVACVATVAVTDGVRL